MGLLDQCKRVFSIDRFKRVLSIHHIWPSWLLGAFASAGLGMERAGAGGGYQIFYWSLLAISAVWCISAAKSAVNDDRARRSEQFICLALRRISLLEGRLIESGQEEKSLAGNWPWGSHHTEALGHLEAAALRWWKLYDPTEADTAPTNKQVSEWLQKERGLSQKMADAMASILRADGLPTGPRK